MPRKGQRIKHRKAAAVKPPGMPPRSPDADPLGHNRLTPYLEDHFEWMLITGYSADTVRARRQHSMILIGPTARVGWADEGSPTSQGGE